MPSHVYGKANTEPDRITIQEIRASITPSIDLHQHSQRNFRPRILRPWPLVALIFVTLSLIGFVEYAAIALPRGPSLLDKLGSDAKTFRHRLGNLTHGDTSSAPLVPRQPSASFSSSFPSIGGDILLSSSSTIYLGAPPSAFVPVTSSFGVTPTPSAEKVHTSFALNPSAFVPTGVSGGSSSVIAPGEPAPSAFVPVKRPVGSSSLVAPGEPAPSAYVPTTPPTTPQASDHPHSDAQARHFYPWWTGVDTFLGSYLATLIAALYRVVWTVVYCSFNLIEPLRALSQPDGASADLAFFSFYQSRSSFLGPIPALLGGRFALGLVAFTALLADLLPAFASESTVVNTNWNCPSPDVSNKHNPCPPRVEVDVGALRILQGLLAFAALVIFWLIYLQFVDKTYIPADPSSIAEIATLTRHPDLIDDFSCVPPDADTSEMKRMFRGRRYRLGFYRSSSGLDYYGIRPTTGGIRFDYRPLPDGSRSSRYPAANHSIHTTGVQTARPRRIWPIDIVLVILILGLFGLVLAYVLDSHYNDGFNTFFNSDTFGPRFILTLSGTAIAALWKSAEQSSVVNAPWNRLATRPSTADSTVLFKPSITPILSTFRALRHGYFSVGAITVVTLLADVGLNTVIGSVAYSTGQFRQQFVVSTYFSLVSLGIMLVVAIMLVFSRFREVRLPRRPDTIGAVMSYVAESPMDNIGKTEYMNDLSAYGNVHVMDKKYSLERVAREDGQYAWTVIAVPA